MTKPNRPPTQPASSAPSATAALMPDGSVWAIRPESISRLAACARMAERAPVGEQPAPRAATMVGGDARVGGSVAVIPLCGIITPYGSWLSYFFGGGSGSLQAFREEFRVALASPDIGAIVLDVDSPGGIVDLVPEMAEEIRAARGTKPIVAVCNTSACSAAYWIAAQADELVVTPSGRAGSIGVYMAHEDWSRAEAEFGVATTLVHFGEHKVDGNMHEPLAGDALASWQQEVNDIGALFVQAVAAGRGVSTDVVLSSFGQGRTLIASRALEAGLVDGIETLEDVIRRQMTAALASSGSASAARIAGRLPARVISADELPADPPVEENPVDPEQPEEEPADPPADVPGEPEQPEDDPEQEPEETPDPEHDPVGDDAPVALTPAERAARAELLTAL